MEGSECNEEDDRKVRCISHEVLVLISEGRSELAAYSSAKPPKLRNSKMPRNRFRLQVACVAGDE